MSRLLAFAMAVSCGCVVMTFAAAMGKIDTAAEPPKLTAAQCEAGGGCVTLTREQIAELLQSTKPCWKRT